MLIGKDLVLKTVQDIEQDNIKTFPQENNQELKEAFKIFKPFCKVEWNKTIEEIHNHIRGLSPYPTAFTEFKNKETEEIFSCKLFKSEKEIVEHNFETGSIHQAKHELKIAVKGGFIKLLELQVAGKKRMDISALLNGFDFNNYTIDWTHSHS